MNEVTEQTGTEKAVPDAAEPPKRQPPHPTIGRKVHYVLAKGPRRGEHRSAEVTGVSESSVNITIFFDQRDDVELKDGEKWEWIGRGWSVPYSQEQTPGTWHWPEMS